MPPHGGLVVDLGAGTHRGRDGQVNPLDRSTLADGALYIAGELPQHRHLRAYENWLLPAHGWVVGRFAVQPGRPPFRCDWYIDIDAITVDGTVWRVHDRLLDVALFEGRRYEVLDTDELADCVEQGSVTRSAAIDALRSLNVLLRALERLDFSGPALLAEYAPRLPMPAMLVS